MTAEPTSGVHSEPPESTPPGETTPQDPALGRVSRAVESLESLDDLPLAEHATHFDRVHNELQSALTEIEGS